MKVVTQQADYSGSDDLEYMVARAPGRPPKVATSNDKEEKAASSENKLEETLAMMKQQLKNV